MYVCKLTEFALNCGLSMYKLSVVVLELTTNELGIDKLPDNQCNNANQIVYADTNKQNTRYKNNKPDVKTTNLI